MTTQIEPGLDVERLVVALQIAEIQPTEVKLGHDLRIVAKRLARAYGKPDPMTFMAAHHPRIGSEPRRHRFLPWSLDRSRCRVTVRVGTGYTLCARTRTAHDSMPRV